MNLSDAQMQAVMAGTSPTYEVTEFTPPVDLPPVPDFVHGFEINWHLPFDNTPTYDLLVADRAYGDEDMGFLYEKKSSVYCAINAAGFATFHYHNGVLSEISPGVFQTTPQDGYAGRHFRLKMAPGQIINGVEAKEVILRGPWHTGVSTPLAAGFPQLVEVTCVRSRFSRFFGFSVTLPLFWAIVQKYDPERRFVWTKHNTLTALEPLTRGGFIKAACRQLGKVNAERYVGVE